MVVWMCGIISTAWTRCPIQSPWMPIFSEIAGNFSGLFNKYNRSESLYYLWTHHHRWHLSTFLDTKIIYLCTYGFILCFSYTKYFQIFKNTQQLQDHHFWAWHIEKTLFFQRWRWPNKSPTAPWPRWTCKHKENMPRLAMLEARLGVGGWCPWGLVGGVQKATTWNSWTSCFEVWTTFQKRWCFSKQVAVYGMPGMLYIFFSFSVCICIFVAFIFKAAVLRRWKPRTRQLQPRWYTLR